MKVSESVTIVLPMYNEVANAPVVIKELDSILDELFTVYEILVVESGSTDGTARVLNELRSSYHNLRIINQGAKLGLGSAIIDGFNSVYTDIAIYMDSDLPFDVAVLRDIFPLSKDVKVLIGYRTGIRESYARDFFSRGYNFLTRTMFGINVNDVNFSFKLLRKEVLDDIHLISKGWFIDAEILARVTKKGYKIHEKGIPYKHRERGESNVNINFKLIKGFLKEMWAYRKHEKSNN